MTERIGSCEEKVSLPVQETRASERLAEDDDD